MKKQLLAVALLLASGTTTIAQTKIKDDAIGSSLPAAGAVLELQSTTRALLLPRVALTNTTTWLPLVGSAPTEGGYTVYNTAASIGGSAAYPIIAGGIGEYYWDGTGWVAKKGPIDWHITGNAGTTPIATVPTAVGTSNYVGTSDANNFVVGVNGISRGIFTQQGSLIGGAGTVDNAGLPAAHTFGAAQPVGSLIWGTGHQLAVAGGNANLAAVFGNGNIVSSSNGFTTGNSNTIGTNSVASMVSGNENNLGNRFQNSIVTGRRNVMNYTGGTSGNGNIIGGQGNRLSGTISPQGAIVGGWVNTITAAGDGFLLMGTGNTISGTMPNAAVVGQSNAPVDNALFMVGNGTPVFTGTGTLADPYVNTGTKSNAMVVFNNGSVAINASSIPSFVSSGVTITPKLHIAGDVASTGAFYTTTGVYADYVFEKYFDGQSDIDKNYSFKSLAEVSSFVKKNKHLPGVTPISEITKTATGYSFDISKLSIQSLEKIEELYLHTIEQHAVIEKQQTVIEKQQAEMQDMKNRLLRLESLLAK